VQETCQAKTHRKSCFRGAISSHTGNLATNRQVSKRTKSMRLRPSKREGWLLPGVGTRKSYQWAGASDMCGRSDALNIPRILEVYLVSLRIAWISLHATQDGLSTVTTLMNRAFCGGLNA